eukprot:2305406-Pleurochrysis_carterae.AAC.1
MRCAKDACTGSSACLRVAACSYKSFCAFDHPRLPPHPPHLLNRASAPLAQQTHKESARTLVLFESSRQHHSQREQRGCAARRHVPLLTLLLSLTLASPSCDVRLTFDVTRPAARGRAPAAAEANRAGERRAQGRELALASCGDEGLRVRAPRRRRAHAAGRAPL